MLAGTEFGWQLVGSKYWFFAQGFLYKAVLIRPFSTLILASRNGILEAGSQVHVSGGGGEEGVGGSEIFLVCCMVNLMLGWMVLI